MEYSLEKIQHLDGVEEYKEKIEELKQKFSSMEDNEKNKTLVKAIKKQLLKLSELQEYLDHEEEQREKSLVEYKECSKMLVVTLGIMFAAFGAYGTYVDAFVRDKDLAFVLTGTLSMVGCEGLLITGSNKKWGTKLYNKILDMKKNGKIIKKEKLLQKIDEIENRIDIRR